MYRALSLPVRPTFLAILAVAAVSGCGDDGPTPAPDVATNDAIAGDTSATDTTVPLQEDAVPPDSATPQTTWHAHVRPLVEHHCSSCHQEGAVGGFSLNNYDDIEGIRPIMVGRVLSGEMPPWPMDPNCREVQDARFLTDEEKAVFQRWRQDGYPEGDPNDFVALPAKVPDHPDTGPSDLILTRAESYVADRRIGDDYRCFVYDHEVTEDTWVSGAHVLPDAIAVAHHVLVYVVPPSQVARVRQLDTAAPGVGYPCLGGVGAGGNESLLAGWVPGMLPMHFPSDSAFLIEAGSKFVIQMHYNTLNVPAADPIPADATRIELWTLPSGQEPDRRVQIQAVLDGDLDIKANASPVVEGATFTSPASATIIGVIPHMHLLGASISLRVQRALTAEVVCLADVPVWDFHWQQVYQYKESDHVPLYFGDALKLECIYDNSPENQAVIDGVQQTSRDVTWGEGTLDEMCLAYIVTSAPWGGAASGVCPGAAQCMRECGAGDALCPVLCMGLAGNACVSCGVQPLFSECGQKECPVPLAMLGICINGCSTPGDVLGCAVNECREELDGLYACLEEPLRAGACDPYLASCDIQVGTDE